MFHQIGKRHISSLFLFDDSQNLTFYKDLGFHGWKEKTTFDNLQASFPGIGPILEIEYQEDRIIPHQLAGNQLLLSKGFTLITFADPGIYTFFDPMLVAVNPTPDHSLELDLPLTYEGYRNQLRCRSPTAEEPTISPFSDISSLYHFKNPISTALLGYISSDHPSVRAEQRKLFSVTSCEDLHAYFAEYTLDSSPAIMSTFSYLRDFD